MCQGAAAVHNPKCTYETNWEEWLNLSCGKLSGVSTTYKDLVLGIYCKINTAVMYFSVTDCGTYCI